MNRQKFLYLITDGGQLRRSGRLEIVLESLLEEHHRSICAVHFRERSDSVEDSRSLFNIAQKLSVCAAHYSVQFVVHQDRSLVDRLNLQCDHSGFPGLVQLHLGQNTYVKNAERQEFSGIDPSLLAPTRFSYSAHDLVEAKQAASAGALYIFAAPVFSPISKPTDTRYCLGLKGLRQWVEQVECPIVALGGITPARAASCRKVGARGVAVLSGVLLADNPQQAIKEYIRSWEAETAETPDLF